MRISWVTSFSADIYKVSGKEFLASVRKFPLPGTLYLGPEGVIVDEDVPNAQVLPDISDSPVLRRWLDRNLDIIPVDKGGRWKPPCKCWMPKKREDKYHNMPCPGAWFCRNASRWFRKVVVLRTVWDSISVDQDTVVIWLDCDIVVRRSPTAGSVLSWFRDTKSSQLYDVLYMKTVKRPVWETGIVAMRGASGLAFFDSMYARYMSGAFRKDRRWDDSFQFMSAATRVSGLKCRDVATDTSGHADVVPHSIYAAYFTHRKGLHSRVTKTVQ